MIEQIKRMIEDKIEWTHDRFNFLDEERNRVDPRDFDFGEYRELMGIRHTLKGLLFDIEELETPAVKDPVQAGHDLTTISAEKWTELMQMVDADLVPVLNPTSLGWHWQGKGVLIVTANDPITGKHYSDSTGSDTGWAGYIGIEGEKSLVRKVYNFIKKNGDTKEDVWGNRDFI